MKYLFCVIALFSILYLHSCGDDNTTNNGNGTGGETVIFSMDSLSINLNGNLAVNDTDIVITDAPNIKITFNCSTNADSINSFASYKISAIDSLNIYLDSINNINSSLNNNHTLFVNGFSYYFLNILIQINRVNSNPYFIRLKNIKIFKLL